MNLIEKESNDFTNYITLEYMKKDRKILALVLLLFGMLIITLLTLIFGLSLHTPNNSGKNYDFFGVYEVEIYSQTKVKIINPKASKNYTLFINDKKSALDEEGFFTFNYSGRHLVKITFNDIPNYEQMFKDCSNLTRINYLNISSCPDCNSAAEMFSGCKRLQMIKTLDLKTDNIVDMSNMFSHAESLTSLNLASFNTKSVQNMSSMFKECHNLKYLDIINFITTDSTDVNDMFKNACSDMKVCFNNDTAAKIGEALPETMSRECLKTN